MTKLSENIVGKIKVDNIAPVPRWHFLFKGYVFWTIFVLSMILGSLSFSVIMHVWSNGDFDMLKHLQGNILTSAVMLLPYFWLVSLMLFAIIAFFNWKHTKMGYKFKRRWIVFCSVASSIFFGSVFYALGMGNAVDRMMVNAMPFYDQSKHKAREELWLQPEIGLIMGKVVNIDSVDNKIVIQDGLGNDWNIDENAITKKEEQNVKKGKIIKIIGKKDGENSFIAKEIRKCGDCQDDEDGDFDMNVTKNTDIQKYNKVIDSNKNTDIQKNNTIVDSNKNIERKQN